MSTALTLPEGNNDGLVIESNKEFQLVDEDMGNGTASTLPGHDVTEDIAEEDNDGLVANEEFDEDMENSTTSTLSVEEELYQNDEVTEDIGRH